MHAWQNDIDRRTFLRLAGAGIGAAVLGSATESISHAENQRSQANSHVQPILRVQADANHASIPFLSWDTEGGDRAQTNLLRENAPLSLRVRMGGEWKASASTPMRRKETRNGGTSYVLALSPDAELRWTIHPSPGKLTMTVSGEDSGIHQMEAVEMIFPFDPRVTPTTIIPSDWSPEGSGILPAVITSPDFGQLLFEDPLHPGLKARLEGSRTKLTFDLVLELPAVGNGEKYVLNMTPVHLPPPHGLADTVGWQKVRRGWFNAWQPSSRWGDQNRPISAPAGILANNVISDPASCSLSFYADQAFWIPEIAPKISMMTHVRYSVDWWLDHRMDPTGEMICYWDYRHFLDANTGILISAWDYVEATGDQTWLKARLPQLELLATFLEQRDVDHDGMVEATQSGNYNTLKQPARSCCWFDATNYGHKDGYSNAFIYRAWRCLAEMEGQIGRRKQQAHYTQLADRLKAVYSKTLYNPATGWLAGWKSADGQLHDYASPVVNGLAIEYGLVEPAEGRKILAALWKEMEVAKFTRLDLGLPCTFKPVLRADYIQGGPALGLPTREDGTDTFEIYQNGSTTAGQTLHFIMAHHIAGEPEKGEKLLNAMVAHQNTVGFQNGVQNKGMAGLDWTTWDGKPCGYEGYLADVFMFLQASVLREPAMRARFYRPLTARPV